MVSLERKKPENVDYYNEMTPIHQVRFKQFESTSEEVDAAPAEPDNSFNVSRWFVNGVQEITQCLSNPTPT